jgi:hypothetical protein
MGNETYQTGVGFGNSHAGRLHRIHGRIHRHMGTLPTGVLMIDVISDRIFIEMDEHGRIALPTPDRVEAMVAAGEITDVLDDAADDPTLPRMAFELDMLDAAGVANGEKSIWLHLSAVWDADLRRRFGDFDDPSTIRRWRTSRAKARSKVDHHGS